MKKVANTRLTINDLPKQIPDFKNSKMSKDRLTEQWLTQWIVSSLAVNKIKRGDILPRKREIAEYLGIAVGTVQNAIRYTEDKGYLQSKQKTGTLIAGYSGLSTLKKQTSKRDVTVFKIKKHILSIGLDAVMPSASDLAKKINVSANTVRLAYIHLCDTGFLQYLTGKTGKKMLRVVELPEMPQERHSSRTSLVEKTEQDLSEFITKNLRKGDKLQTRLELSKILNVSVKTVHDAVDSLEGKGILLSRRGRYGTIVSQMPSEAAIFQPMKERSIFAKADDAIFYRWEKIQNALIKMINEDFEPGMKLPSMDILSEKFNVSTNTIRKALRMLSNKGYVDFQRGRYGGTFVIDIPEKDIANAYEWIAVTPDYIPVGNQN